MSAQLSKISVERSNGFKPSLMPELLLGLRDLTVRLNDLGQLLVDLDDAMREKQNHDSRKHE